MNKSMHKLNGNKRLALLLILVVLYVLMLAVGVSYAYIKTAASPVTNWFSTGARYVLSYSPNGGDGSVEADVFQAAAGTAWHEFTVKSGDGLTREGYSFLGWADAADADTAQYTAGDSITLDLSHSAKTLYAVWLQDVTYTLTYDLNGGAAEPAIGPDTYAGGESSHSFTVTDRVPQREGYIFLGWADAADADAAQYTAGDSITLIQSSPGMTVYAVWQEEAVQQIYTYTLKFNRNIPGGAEASVTLPSSVVRTSADATYTMSGGNVILEDANADNTGLVFLGWALGEDADIVFPAGTPISIDMAVEEGNDSAEQTLYAVWDFEYYVRFSRNVDDNSVGKYRRSDNTLVNTDKADMIICSGNSQTVPVRAVYDSSEYLYRRSGNMLAGFSLAADGRIAMQTLTIARPGRNNAETVYAIWTPGSFALIYDANGGSSAPASEIINEAATSHVFTVTSSQPTAPAGSNAVFLGWAETAGATAAAYHAGDRITLTENSPSMTLYAVWQYTYTLTFDKGTGDTGTAVPETITISTTARTCEFSIPASPIPEKTSWSFLFWTENAERQSGERRYYGAGTVGVRTKITAGCTSPNLTLYAHYNPDDGYKLVFNANGGSGAPGAIVTRTTEYRPVFQIPAAEPSRSNYTFLGWAESSTATVPDYQAGDFVYGDGDVQTKTLYAVWRHWNEYVVYVDYNGGAYSYTTLEGCDTVTKYKYSFTSSVEYGDTEGVHTFSSVGNFEPPTLSGSNLAGFGYSGNSVNYGVSKVILSSKKLIKNVKLDITDSRQNITAEDMGGYTRYTLTLYAVWSSKTVYNQYELVLNDNARELSSSTYSKTHTKNVLATSDENGYYTFEKPKYYASLARVGYSLAGFAYDNTATVPDFDISGGKLTGNITVDQGGEHVASYTKSDSSNIYNGSRLTLYAVWEMKQIFEVSLDPNGGTYTSSSYTTTDTVTQESDLTAYTFASAGTFTVPTRTGYTLLGYAYSPDAEAPDFVPSSTTSSFTLSNVTVDKADAGAEGKTVEIGTHGNGAPKTTLTLYAVWKLDGTYFKVKLYNQNGSSVVRTAAYEPAGTTSHTFAENKLQNGSTYFGFKLLGYAYEPDAATPVYNSGSTYISDPVTVTADAQNVTSEVVDGVTTYTLTLYPVLEKQQIFTLKIDLGEGYYRTSSSSSELHTYSQSVQADIAAESANVDYSFKSSYNLKVQRSGFLHGGFAYKTLSDTADFSDLYTGTVEVNKTWLGQPGYTVESSVNENGVEVTTLTIYPVWYITLSYSANGGNGAPASITRYETEGFSRDFDVSSQSPTRGNYLFAGWARGSAETSPAYGVAGHYTSIAGELSDTITFGTYTSGVTLYAIWAQPFRLVYSGNAADFTNDDTLPEPETAYGIAAAGKVATHSFEISSKVPTRNGYTFLGWSQDPDAAVPSYTYDEGDDYPKAFTVSGNSDGSLLVTTLYAVWQSNAAPAAASAMSLSSYTALAACASEDPAREYSYRLVYDNEGLNVTLPGEVTAKDGESHVFALSDEIPAREGFVFLGWTDHKGDSAPKYTQDDADDLPGQILVKADPAADVTELRLYAVWADAPADPVTPETPAAPEQTETKQTAEGPSAPPAGKTDD